MPTPDTATLGRVVGLWRYPVKSMGPDTLDEAQISWDGLVGDRRWAFVRDGAVQNAFPWLTIRDRPDMSHYLPSYTDPDEPQLSPTTVRTPSGAVLGVADPALAAELCPDGARVIRQHRGIFDAFPLSVISIQTLEALDGIVGFDLDVQRFRPNILVDAATDAPFPEDDWVGSVIRIGDARMRVDARDGRCKVITIDPRTTERDPGVMRAVVEERDGKLGVYGATVEPGRVAVGDVVFGQPD
jgi:uncharacterized protein YcbX